MFTQTFFHILAQIPDQVAEPAVEDSRGNLIVIIWVVAVIMVSAFLLLRTMSRVRQGQRKVGLPAKDRVTMDLPKARGLHHQIQQLMAELAELSRQINGQIDTRVAKLEILQRDADQRIALLQSLLSQTASGVGDPLPQNAIKPHSKSVTNSSESVEITPEAPGSLPEGNNSVEPSPETQIVLNLARQGKSPLAIAQEIQRPLGEIELILAINKK